MPSEVLRAPSIIAAPRPLGSLESFRPSLAPRISSLNSLGVPMTGHAAAQRADLFGGMALKAPEISVKPTLTSLFGPPIAASRGESLKLPPFPKVEIPQVGGFLTPKVEPKPVILPKIDPAPQIQQIKDQIQSFIVQKPLTEVTKKDLPQIFKLPEIKVLPQEKVQELPKEVIIAKAVEVIKKTEEKKKPNFRQIIERFLVAEVDPEAQKARNEKLEQAIKKAESDGEVNGAAVAAQLEKQTFEETSESKKDKYRGFFEADGSWRKRRTAIGRLRWMDVKTFKFMVQRIDQITVPTRYREQIRTRRVTEDEERLVRLGRWIPLEQLEVDMRLSLN